MPASPFRCEPDGLRLAVRLTPRSRRAGIVGVAAASDGRPLLAIQVTAPPVEGAANQALIACLAEALGVPKRAVRIRSGETGRVKIVDVVGDAAALAARLSICIRTAQDHPPRRGGKG